MLQGSDITLISVERVRCRACVVKASRQPADFAGAQAECDITELHFGPEAMKGLYSGLYTCVGFSTNLRAAKLRQRCKLFLHRPSLQKTHQ